MPFCPKCLLEYQPEFDVCEDCQVNLVDELPVEIPEDYADIKWIEVHTFPGSLYARMAVEMLIREGLYAYSISNFGAAGLIPAGGADFTGASATVFVPEQDYKQALSIIEPMIAELPGHFNDDDLEDYDE